MIDKYLISNCLFIIDEFNSRYHDIKIKDELKSIADIQFNEADLVVRLGYPFRQMANFNMQGNAHDIVVKMNDKDFVIEVKYLRNFKTKNTYSNKMKWEEAFQKDYDWLCSEIKNGRKGNRAFVLGWFNAVDRFSQIMQLGQGDGYLPEINEARLSVLPFLNYDPSDKKTRSITYMYAEAYKEHHIRIPGYSKESVTCMFLGKETDKFHFAMYY